MNEHLVLETGGGVQKKSAVLKKMYMVREGLSCDGAAQPSTVQDERQTSSCELQE